MTEVHHDARGTTPTRPQRRTTGPAGPETREVAPEAIGGSLR